MGTARLRIRDLSVEEFEEAIGGARAVGGDDGGDAVSEWNKLLLHARHPIGSSLHARRGTGGIGGMDGIGGILGIDGIGGIGGIEGIGGATPRLLAPA
ncbi:MAG TPA: hypothetical protein VMU78_01480 [Methylocella sp.]|nr:hypothetical protein [Methylocella sp.]